MTLGNTQVAERLKALRASWRLSQAEIAERMGVSLRSYQSYEQAIYKPKAEDIARLAEHGVDLNWLLTGDGGMFRGQREPAPMVAEPVINADVLARIADGVSGVFRQLNQTARPADIVRLAVEIYPDVADLTDEAELRGALTVLLRHLRERLLRAASGDTSGKLQA